MTAPRLRRRPAWLAKKQADARAKSGTPRTPQSEGEAVLKMLRAKAPKR